MAGADDDQLGRLGHDFEEYFQLAARLIERNQLRFFSAEPRRALLNDRLNHRGVADGLGRDFAVAHETLGAGLDAALAGHFDDCGEYGRRPLLADGDQLFGKRSHLALPAS